MTGAWPKLFALCIPWSRVLCATCCTPVTEAHPLSAWCGGEGSRTHMYTSARGEGAAALRVPLHSSEFATPVAFRASVYNHICSLTCKHVSELYTRENCHCTYLEYICATKRREEGRLAKTERTQNSIEMYRAKTKLRKLRALARARPLSTLVNRYRLANSRFSVTVAAPAVLTRTRFTT